MRSSCLSVLEGHDGHLEGNSQNDPDYSPHNAEYEDPFGLARVIVLEHEEAYEATHPPQE